MPASHHHSRTKEDERPSEVTLRSVKISSTASGNADNQLVRCSSVTFMLAVDADRQPFAWHAVDSPLHDMLLLCAHVCVRFAVLDGVVHLTFVDV